MSPNAWSCLLYYFLLPTFYPHLMYNSWFDVCISDWPTKKSEKRNKLQRNDGDGPWHLNDNSGALFCMPNNDEFKSSYLGVVTKPYVFMQPPIDTPEGHGIIGAILEHRIAVLQGKGLAPELPIKEFYNLQMHRFGWMWPRTSDTGHLALPPEVRNKTRYLFRDVKNSALFDIWESFLATLGKQEKCTAPKYRLPVFASMTKDGRVSQPLPRHVCLQQLGKNGDGDDC